jgi:DNA repair protein RadC
MKAQTLESETFGSGSRNYFIDFSKATNQSNYIKITRSDRQPDNTYLKNSVVIFEEDFSFLIESFSMLFTSVIYRKEKTSVGATGTASVSPELRNRGIKSWAPEKRPREKLLEGGAGSVSNVELLALLIGSGTTKETAVDLAARILKSVGGDLNALSELPLKKLTRFPGIGDAKAVNIMAALELSRRRNAILFPYALKAV